jgi:redox-sensitive bicupin YhaK (pirin superfamily)
MSDLLKISINEKCTDNPCQAIEMTIEPPEKDLGGLTVRRCLPSKQRKMVGPFIFFDHAGPATFAAGEGLDVRPHPHINLATITYLFEGEILHRDNLGIVQPIRPGEINLMVAGKGIVHSERTAPETRTTNHKLHALQLWIGLPEEDEEVEPSFHHYDSTELPTLQKKGLSLRVMIGEAYGLTSPVRTFSPTLYIEATLESGASIQLPDTISERALYLISGQVKMADNLLEANRMFIFDQTPDITLTACEPTRLVIIGGEPLGKRKVWWNFVSSRPERIEQAKQDWLENRFDKVPGETEFIPLPE